MTKRILFIFSFLVVVATASWYFDIFHKSVETVNDLVGQNLDYATKLYFRTDPDETSSFNINKPLNELQFGILTERHRIKDSIVNQYTWTFFNHKVTIWTATTDKLQGEIVDAIRYKNGVTF